MLLLTKASPWSFHFLLLPVPFVTLIIYTPTTEVVDLEFFQPWDATYVPFHALGDLWEDAKVVDCMRYLFGNRNLSLPQEWRCNFPAENQWFQKIGWCMGTMLIGMHAKLSRRPWKSPIKNSFLGNIVKSVTVTTIGESAVNTCKSAVNNRTEFTPKIVHFLGSDKFAICVDFGGLPSKNP